MPIVVGVICALIGTIALYFLIRRLYPNAFVSISKNVINFIFDSVLIFIFFKYESPMGSQGPGIEWRNFLLQCCSVVLNCIHGRRRLAHWESPDLAPESPVPPYFFFAAMPENVWTTYQKIHCFLFIFLYVNLRLIFYWTKTNIIMLG